MTFVEKILPASANNDYRGSPIAFYAFIVLSILYTGRSLIHFLKNDSGVNSIASFINFGGTPDPDRLVYMYSSLWGSQQLITVAIFWLVACKYRTLLPCMYLMVIFELLLRFIPGRLHQIGPEYFEHTPPGSAGNLPLLLVACVMLILSLRQRQTPRSAVDDGSC